MFSILFFPISLLIANWNKRKAKLQGIILISFYFIITPFYSHFIQDILLSCYNRILKLHNHTGIK